MPSFSRFEFPKQSVLNSVALSVAISVAFHSTEDFLSHRSRKPKNVIYRYCFFYWNWYCHWYCYFDCYCFALAIAIAILFPSCHPLLHRGLGWGQKKPRFVRNRVFKERRRHTLPQIAVPSAQAGLTSLFGMGRGEPRRNNHLKVVVTWGNFLIDNW